MNLPTTTELALIAATLSNRPDQMPDFLIERAINIWFAADQRLQPLREQNRPRFKGLQELNPDR